MEPDVSMNVLILAPHPFFVERGTPIAVRMVAETLAAAGHRVDILTVHLGQDIHAPGVTIYRTRLLNWISSVPIGFSPAKVLLDCEMMVRMWKLIAAGRYDVVHAVEDSIFFAVPVRWFTRARLIYDMDSVMSQQIAEKWPAARWIAPIIARCERWAIRSADVVLAVCPAIVRIAEEHHTATPIRLLPDTYADPAPPSERPELLRGPSDHRPLALYVGNLEPYQGIGLLLEAMALLPPPGRPLLVVIGGLPEHIERFSQLARTLEIAENVRFLGPRAQDALFDYLLQADILCSPRLQGINTPMKIYSYMASGRCIVATAIESHTQVLDEDCAFLGSPDAPGYAAALRRALASGAERECRAARATARAKQEYSRPAFAKRLLDAYRSLPESR